MLRAPEGWSPIVSMAREALAEVQPRRLPRRRDTRLKWHRYRAVGGQSLRMRRNGRFRSRHHPSGNGIGQGGVPKRVGAVADQFGTNPNPGQPLPPGTLFSQLAKAKDPGTSLPDAYGAALNQQLQTDQLTHTPPGLGVKTVTPGCSHGRGVSGSVIGQQGNACAAP